jgi:ADP-ribose pyrophosphatase YjhB (NUDIX family)
VGIMRFNLKQSRKEKSRIEELDMGSAVLIIKNNCLLLGKRKADVGNGLYALPGGHQEVGETPTECAIREVKEETNLDIKDLEEIGFDTDGDDFLTLFYVVYIDSDDDLENVEPDKSEDWKWYSVDALPSPLFGEIKRMVKRL